MDATVIATLVSVLALAIAGYAIYRSHSAGTPITADLLTATLQTSQSSAQELTDVALTAAQAAEQLWRTGKIAKGERLNRAFDYVKQWFPDLDQATIVTAIEAGVLVVNSIVEALPSKDAPAPHVPARPGYPGSVP